MKLNTKPLLCLALILASLGAFAQTWSTYSLTGTDADVTPAAMAEDGDGYIYVVGTTPGSNKNIVVMKFTSAGALSLSQEIGTGEVEEGFDIAIGPDGKVYVLGRYKDNTTPDNPTLLVTCLTTSLSTSWQHHVTAYMIDGVTESSEVLPYRIVTGGTSQSPFCYVTAQIKESTFGFGIDLKDPASAKGIMYAKVASGGVSWQGVWDGNTGDPDNLFGTHAVSNGLAIVTSTIVNSGGTDYKRTHYVKVNSSGAVSWAAPPTISTPGDGTHNLAQTTVHGDEVYASFQLTTSGSGVYDCLVGVDCSATSTPSTWIVDAYRYFVPGLSQLHTNMGLGVGYWNNTIIGVGYGWLSPGGTSSNPLDPSDYASWVRELGGSTFDFGFDQVNGLVAHRYVPTPNQRCFDAYNGRLFGLARGLTTTSFRTLTYDGSRDELTTNLAGGYSTNAGIGNGSPLQVLAGKNTDSMYVLLNVLTSGTEGLALFKYDR
jgi:hypothetical protein